MSLAAHQEEEVQERPFNLRLVTRLVVYLLPYKPRVLAALCLILIAAVSSQVGPYLTKIGVDDYILKGDLTGLYRIVLLFFASIAVQFVAQFGQTLVTEMTGQYVMRDLRRQIFRHLQRLPMRYFDRTPLGRIMTRATNDVEALNEFFTEGVVSIFMDLFTLIAILAFMARMDGELTLVSCVAIPVLAVATFYLQGKAMVAYRELRLRLARLNAYLQENISGMEVVQLFNRQERNLADFAVEHLPYRKAEEREIHYYAIFFPFTELVGTLGMAAIIWYGARSVLDLRIEVGVLVAFLQYIRLGQTAISDQQVAAAARYVNAHRFIDRLPGKYAQPVAEAGSTLSTGERQLLSFARALAFDPEILVLDEATASIDTETEQLIQEAIARLMHDRTSIVIAHRLSTIRSADQILVLHHGQVRERGRHDELIQLGGIYARLYQLHYSGQDD